MESVARTLLEKTGTIGVIPTDTIYGVVARASDMDAVSRLYELKHRDHKPGTVIAANVDQLVNLGVKRRYLKAVEYLWPGPISIEIPHSVDYLSQSTGRQGFRIPNDVSLTRVLLQTGPLLTSSANQPGKPPADTIEEARAYFGDKVDFYIDGGNLSQRLPSTVVRIVDDAVEVLRQGAVKIDEQTGRVEHK